MPDIRARACGAPVRPAPSRRPPVLPAVEPLEARHVPSAATLAVASGVVRSTESFGRLVADAYTGFLGRTPDPAGFAGWVGQLRLGADPELVEAAFVASSEYRAAAGDDASWVGALYRDLLGRAPDAASLAAWLDALSAGASPAQVAAAFATSRERQALVLAGYYDRLLGRAPEPGAVGGWLDFLAGGNDRADVATQIVASDEFFAAHGNSPSAFVAGAYEAVLGRTPAAAEVAGWLAVYEQSSLPAPAVGAFDIVVRGDGLTPSQLLVFERAAARWEQIITGDLPDAVYQGVAVDDLLIDARAVPIDGPGETLGRAGPDSFRRASRLPVHGTMEFDTADLASLEATGRLYDVVLHEMGHVLGVGTLWRLLGLVGGAGTADPRFLGPRATAEFNALFGTDAPSVPVEGPPAPASSRDSHWRESVFGGELMTPYLSGPPSPISRVTVASLADLGYTVNLAAADPYAPKR